METFMGREVVRHSPARVGKKIAILEHEGKPPAQAIAMALSMERAHRLTNEGGYKRVRKK